METRAAPSEAEHPRVHAPDATWLAKVPLSQTIRLNAPSEPELQRRAASRSNNRRSVGFGRTTDGAVSTVTAGRGEPAMRFLVSSPSAIHLRAAIAFSDSAQYRITAYRPGDEGHAVSLFRKSGNATRPLQTVWTPITDGEEQVVVVERIDEATEPWSVDVPQISHFDRALEGTGAGPEGFGDAALCQWDMACIYQVAPTAMQSGVVHANFAVALMTFTQSNGLSYLCTGTLLNSASYPSPLFLTAFHCLSDAESVASLITIWFYNRVSCRTGGPGPATVQVAGGATRIFGSEALDAALVVLNQMPPTLATYTGWDASTMQPGTTILAIHHPAGDVKKASFGTELGINVSSIQFNDPDVLFPAETFYIVSWQLGTVQPGSSGSGLLSFDANTSLFYLRGTLTGGDATCDATGATTYYARFDNLYPHIQTALTQTAQPPANNYQGLWWNAPAGSESGWGINLAHQGDIIFASWFTYDLTGKGLWLVMTAPKTAPNTYSGTLYQTTGPPFNAVPFNPAAVVGTNVGTGTLTFSDANNGTFAYTVNGVSQMKNITRQVFGSLPTCTSGAGNPAAATNYQALWWAAPASSESGWGINFAHEGDTIFATWFTYDLDGKPMWLVVTAPKIAPGTYSGTLYRTTGPAFNAVPFNPASVAPTAVGTVTLNFTDGNTGTFAYTVNGVAQVKAITREVFSGSGTICQ